MHFEIVLLYHDHYYYHVIGIVIYWRVNGKSCKLKNCEVKEYLTLKRNLCLLSFAFGSLCLLLPTFDLSCLLHSISRFALLFKKSKINFKQPQRFNNFFSSIGFNERISSDPKQHENSSILLASSNTVRVPFGSRHNQSKDNWNNSRL